MKAVVTGATGHLGRYVVHRLASLGMEVVAVSRSGAVPTAPFGATAPVAPLSARSLALDLGDDNCVELLSAELGEGVTLVHLAAWHPPVTAQSSAADRRVLFDVNVLGTLRLLDAARRTRRGVLAVVYASTFEVYGVPETPGPVTELTPTIPVNDYGATKLSGEDHLLAFAEEERVRVVALRMPAVYGPGERVARALPNFLHAVKRGERPRIHGDGCDRRDQLHVSDAALAIERAVSTEASGVYNVSDGAGHSIRELAQAAMAAAGMGGEPEFAPAIKRRFDFHMSIARARAELGFAPRVELRDGMREQLDWLRTGEQEPA